MCGIYITAAKILVHSSISEKHSKVFLKLNSLAFVTIRNFKTIQKVICVNCNCAYKKKMHVKKIDIFKSKTLQLYSSYPAINFK